VLEICGKGIQVHGRLVRVARLDADKYHFLDDPTAMIEGLQKCGTRIDLFTFMQRLPETEKKYSYPMELDNLAVLPVSTFDHWWNQQIKSYPRNRARQAAKRGVVMREVPFDDTLVKGIWEIYNETPVRQGRRFPHYGKNIETVYKEAATYLDSSVFVGAFLGDSLIGFIKLVHDETKTQAGLMNILSMTRHRDKAPTNALIAEAVRSCAERRIPYLVYANFVYADKQNSSLTHFKEVNGFSRVDLPRYYVPLTGLGRAALQFGLHRRLAERIPEPVAAKMRDLREAWLHLRFQSAVESN
jgi:hypothetical protein